MGRLAMPAYEERWSYEDGRLYVHHVDVSSFLRIPRADVNELKKHLASNAHTIQNSSAGDTEFWVAQSLHYWFDSGKLNSIKKRMQKAIDTGTLEVPRKTSERESRLSALHDLDEQKLQEEKKKAIVQGLRFFSPYKTYLRVEREWKELSEVWTDFSGDSALQGRRRRVRGLARRKLAEKFETALIRTLESNGESPADRTVAGHYRLCSLVHMQTHGAFVALSLEVVTDEAEGQTFASWQVGELRGLLRAKKILKDLPDVLEMGGMQRNEGGLSIPKSCDGRLTFIGGRYIKFELLGAFTEHPIFGIWQGKGPHDAVDMNREWTMYRGPNYFDNADNKWHDRRELEYSHIEGATPRQDKDGQEDENESRPGRGKKRMRSLEDHIEQTSDDSTEQMSEEDRMQISDNDTDRISSLLC